MKEVVLSLLTVFALTGQVASWYLLKDDVTAVCTREGRRSADDGLHACLAAVNDAAQNLRTPLIPRNRRLSVYLDVIFDASPTIFNVCCEQHAAGGRIVTVNPLDTESRTDALETRNVPFINLEKIGNDFIEEQFTLILVKSSYDDRYLGVPDKPLILWMVTNIDRDTVSNGHVQIPYLGPACAEPDNSYMFLLYRQSAAVPRDLQNYSDPSACPEMKENAYRCQFDVNRYVTDNSMQLVGSSWFHCVHSTYTVYKMIHEMNFTEADACVSSKLSTGEVMDGKLVCPDNWISGFFSNPLRFGNIPKRAPVTEKPGTDNDSGFSGMPQQIAQFLNLIFGYGDDGSIDDATTDASPMTYFEPEVVNNTVDVAPASSLVEGNTVAQAVVDDVNDGNGVLGVWKRDVDTAEKTPDLPVLPYPAGPAMNDEIKNRMSGFAVATDEVGEMPSKVEPPVGKIGAFGGEIFNGLEEKTPSLGKIAGTGGEIYEGPWDRNPPLAKVVATGGELGGAPLDLTQPAGKVIVSGGEVNFDETEPESAKLFFKSALDSNDDYTQNTPGTTAPLVELPRAIDLNLPKTDTISDTSPITGQAPPFPSSANLPGAIDLNLPQMEPVTSINTEPSISQIAVDPIPPQIAVDPIPERLLPSQLRPLPLLPSQFQPLPFQPSDVPDDDVYANPPVDPPRFSNDLIGDTGMDDDDRIIDFKGLVDQLFKQSNVPQAAPEPFESEPPSNVFRRLFLPNVHISRPMPPPPPPPSPYRSSRLTDYFRMLGLPLIDRSRTAAHVQFPFFQQRQPPVVYSRLSISRFPGYSNAIQSMEKDGVQSVSYVETPSPDRDNSISSLTGTVYDGVLQGDIDEPQRMPEGLFPNPLTIDLSEPVLTVQRSAPIQSPLERFLGLLRNGPTDGVIGNIYEE